MLNGVSLVPMVTSTRSQAQEAGRLSGIARRERAKKLEFLSNLAVERAVNPPAEPLNPHALKIAMLDQQISRIDTVLATAETAAEFRDLTNAKSRLMELWAKLAGIPSPGSRRPGREPVRRQPMSIEPVVPPPVISPAEPAKPEPGP